MMGGRQRRVGSWIDRDDNPWDGFQDVVEGLTSSMHSGQGIDCMYLFRKRKTGRNRSTEIVRIDIQQSTRLFGLPVLRPKFSGNSALAS